MNRLPKEKRDKLILVCMITGIALLVIYLLLIHPEYASIQEAKAQTETKRQKLENMQDAIDKAATTAATLEDTVQLLSQSEKDMATGDPNAWIYDTIRGFKSQYKMDITIASPTSIGEVDIMGKFPYRQLKVTINGSAYYHDLGKFIADFENDYPHGRICNLSIHPSGNGEKLTFTMDIVALIKPNQS
ncbi:MAG TPA: type II secretion system protein GspM [Verrucomicrobiae bacterium]|jgi:Tfp pilus assembly protein PilO